MTSNVEKIRDEVLNAIDEHHQNECNKVIQDMVKGRGLLAALYVTKLYIAWKRISAASNVIKDENKFRQIEKNIKHLEKMVAELVAICSTKPKYEIISKRMTLISTTYNRTLSLICRLRVKIDSHIQNLDLLGDVEAVDSVMAFGTAAAQGYEVWSTWDYLTAPTKWLGVASTSLFALIGVVNAGMSYMTREKLEQLRKDFNVVNRFQSDLDELYNEAERVIVGHTV